MSVENLMTIQWSVCGAPNQSSGVSEPLVRDLLERHTFRPVCHPQLRSSELRSWHSPSTPIPLLSSDLPFVLHLFRVSVEEEIGHSLPWAPTEDGAYAELPKSGSTTSDALSELPFVGAVHLLQSRIWVTQSVVGRLA